MIHFFKHNFKTMLLVVLFVCFLIFPAATTVYANTTAGLTLTFDDSGTLTIITYGKKATSGTRYETLGWTIKKNRSAISSSNPSARLKPEIVWEEPDASHPGYAYGHYVISADTVYQKIKAVSPEWADSLYRSGGTVYLDAIMTVEENGRMCGAMDANGKTSGEVYFTYEGIAKARGWAKPQDLHSYFDHGIRFPQIKKEDGSSANRRVIVGMTPAEMSNLGAFTASAASGGFDLSQGIPSSESIRTDVSLPTYNLSATITKHTTYRNVDTGKTAEDGKPIYRREYYDYYTLDELWGYELVGAGYLDGGLFGGNASMSGAGSSGATDLRAAAARIMADPEGAADQTLYENSHYGTRSYSATKQILPEAVNGSYGLSWKAQYRKIVFIRGGRRVDQSGETVTVASAGLRSPRVASVIVHTPVVCDLQISDEKAWNQQVKPTSETSLTLGRPFTVNASTYGQHRGIPGYGRRDYLSYTKTRQVKFPFAVCNVSAIPSVSKKNPLDWDQADWHLVREETAQKVIPANTWITLNGSTVFYLPPEVDCGDYLIESRCISINNGQLDEAELEEKANLDAAHTIAIDQETVHVSGRIYGFTVTEVVDYPRWQAMREQKLSYLPGLKDENGVQVETEPKKVLPILLGSHPEQTDLAAVGLGYRIKFRFQTMGDFEAENASIYLRPKFYWVDEDFTHRQEVNLYYEKDGGLVCIGNSEDLKNLQHTDALEDYSFGLIHLTGVSKTVLSAGQIWKGEYFLPSQLYVTPKETDLNSYMRAQGGHIPMRDAVFRKKGYLIVQMEACAFLGESPDLFYGNFENAKNGYCNMWEKEGFVKERAWKDGNLARLADGEVFVFDCSKNMDKDYKDFGIR